MHSLPPVHGVPHAPQLAISLFVSTQEAVQFVRLRAQPSAHAPWLQTPSVPVQAVPHAPQFFGSFVRFAHAVPHRVTARARARALRARLARAARRRACAAMILVAREVDARLPALLEARAATRAALTEIADLVGRAFDAAATAVVRVRLRVRAEVAARQRVGAARQKGSHRCRRAIVDPSLDAPSPPASTVTGGSAASSPPHPALTVAKAPRARADTPTNATKQRMRSG